MTIKKLLLFPSHDPKGLTDGGQLFFIRCDTAQEERHLRTTANILIPPGQAIAMETSAATTVTSLWSFTVINGDV